MDCYRTSLTFVAMQPREAPGTLACVGSCVPHTVSPAETRFQEFAEVLLVLAQTAREPGGAGAGERGRDGGGEGGEGGGGGGGEGVEGGGVAVFGADPSVPTGHYLIAIK